MGGKGCLRHAIGDIIGTDHENTWPIDGHSSHRFTRYRLARLGLTGQLPRHVRGQPSFRSREKCVKTANFLYPRDLEVTPSSLGRILFIGSCLSEAYIYNFREFDRSVQFDHILFNNASDLPEKSTEEIDRYDLQYIQIPLRSVLTDAIVRIVDNDRREDPIDWLDLGMRNIDAMLEKALHYNKQTKIMTIVSNFIVPQGQSSPSLIEQGDISDISYIIRELNSYLSNKVRQFENCYIADVEMIASTIGKQYFLDDIIYFYTHGSALSPMWAELETQAPWTLPEPGRIEPVPPVGEVYELRVRDFFETVYRQIEFIWRVYRQVDAVKLVIFDLDNTMWRGLVGEHYGRGKDRPFVDNWPLGLWEAIQHLRQRGIIVSIASKNDHYTVIDRWNDAIHFGFLKFDDFTSPRINWNPKAQNIGDLLQDLSLTPRSVVFVDDNPVERASVKAAYPDIRVIGSNPFLTRRILLWSPETHIVRRNDVTSRREDMLRKQVDRENVRTNLSREDFLKSLDCRIQWSNIASSDDKSFSRVFELVNKTNQFNTNGKRWTSDDYRRHWDGGGRIFAFDVKDKYSEYGLVGVIFTEHGAIKQYVMSCRVLGMDIEIAAIMRTIIALRDHESGMSIAAHVVETSSNMPCRDVYARAGFQSVGDGRFIFAGDALPTLPGHIRFEDDGG